MSDEKLILDFGKYKNKSIEDVYKLDLSYCQWAYRNPLIKQYDETETMYGNIIVPDLGKEKPLMGEVIAVGPGVYSVTGQTFLETKVKVGEIVVFPSFGGTKMTIDGEEYVVMKEQDLLAILEK